jgi:DNA-binding NarL/FixJ family response regulator
MRDIGVLGYWHIISQYPNTAATATLNIMAEEILVVEDDAFTRSGIEGYLQSLGYAVLTAADAQTGWELAVAQRPQTAVIDIRLPFDGRTQTGPVTESHGIGLSLRLKETFPTLGIVLLSAHHEYEAEVIRLAQRFVRGVAFLHKGGDMRRLESAIERVQTGRTLFNSDIANKQAVETAVTAQLSPEERPYIRHALNEFPRLTPRAQEIAHLLAAAHTPGSVASRLALARGSVENHITRIYRKLGLAEMKKEASGLRPLPILTKTCLLHDIRAG